jgi:hypothetical protein
MNLSVMPRYQPKSFTATSSMYSVNSHYYVSGARYSVIDHYANSTWLDYSSYTKISGDQLGNYLYIDMSSLVPGRTYRINIQADINGCQKTFIGQQLFEVTE